MSRRPAPSRRAYWLKQLHQWHWISSALCLLGMLGFAITGWTLNNAGLIEARPRVTTVQEEMPAYLLQMLQQASADKVAAKSARRAIGAAGGRASGGPLPPAVADWLHERLDIRLPAGNPEWSVDEVYVSMPRPGGDAWVSIALDSGQLEYERTERGVIAYLNDLHKGRHTGTAWSWFIDIFAGACLVFSLTGLLLLKLHAGHRRATWPMVGMGVVVPLLLVAMLVH